MGKYVIFAIPTFIVTFLFIFYQSISPDTFHLQYKHSGTSANRKYLQMYRHKWLRMKALTTFFFKRERYNRTWWTLFWTHGFVLLSNWLKLWFQERKVLRSMRADIKFLNKQQRSKAHPH